MAVDLTICSVYHSSESKRMLELNWELTNRLNATRKWVWIVANNAPPNFSEEVDKNKFLVVPGATQEQSEILERLPSKSRGNYHHAMAVNNSLKYVKTRFMLILDCDLFIIRPEWISEILDYMQKKNLGFFGRSCFGDSFIFHSRHFIYQESMERTTCSTFCW